MIKSTYTYLLLAAVFVFTGVLQGCQEEFDLNGVPPTQEDASFSTERDASTDNIVIFTATGEGFIKSWDLGNGQTVKGETARGVYPDAGSYVVTLTVYNEAGSVSSSQTIVIAEDDPTLLDKPLFNALTGGVDATEGKTWVIDSASADHFGVGPNPPSERGKIPEWYAAGANEKSGGGLYNDRYTFMLAGYGFEMETQGDIYLNGAHTADFPGAFESPVGDFTAPYVAPDGLQWQITEPEGENPILTISQGGFLGYYTGVRTYEILSITEDVMELRYLDAASDGLSWYIRLIRAGYDSTGGGDGGGGDGGGEATYPSFPVTFEEENVTYLWGDFGGTSGSVIANPDKSGINTSDSVMQIAKGAGAETWAGTNFLIDAPINFGGNPVITMKVWSPRAGVPILLKLENTASKPSPSEGPTVFAEQTVNTTVANGWETLSFDYTDAPNFDMGIDYDAFTIFYDFGTAGQDEVAYIDDIMLAQGESTGLTLADLTGGSSKAWKLKPAAGSFKVGSFKGGEDYWPQGADISGDRPCLFNDLFIFKDGGEFEYDAQSDIYGEAYMGVADGCQDEANLDGTVGEAWKSGIHTFNFTPADGDTPATITVSGTGAFIALPKAYNGGEYDNNNPAAPTTDGAVTYEVLDYKTGASEELTITLDYSGNGSGYWTFVLIPNS